jgi:hypothetical protein
LTQGHSEWSMHGIFRRLRTFIKVSAVFECYSRAPLSALQPGAPRHSSETVQILETHWATASTRPGAKEAIKKDWTARGVKDTFQAHFLDELFDSYKLKHTVHTREAALRDTVASLLRQRQAHEHMINPFLRVEGKYTPLSM